MLKYSLFFSTIMLLLICSTMLFAFENIQLEGHIIFNGIYKTAGLNSLNLKDSTIRLIYPYKKHTDALLLLPQKNQIIVHKHNFRQRIYQINFESLKDKSTSISIDLGDYFGPYSIANSFDEDIIIFSCTRIEERTKLRGKTSNMKGRYNYNKSILFHIDLKNENRIKEFQIPHIEGNLSLSPNNQEIAFDFIQFIEENRTTFDEVLKSGVGIVSLSDNDEIIFKENISFYKWSPNGQYNSYLKNSELFIENSQDSSIKKIKIPGMTLQYVWSPNSKYIALQYLKGFYGILSKTILIDTESGKFKILLDYDQFLTDRRHLTTIQWIK